MFFFCKWEKYVCWSIPDGQCRKNPLCPNKNKKITQITRKKNQRQQFFPLNFRINVFFYLYNFITATTKIGRYRIVSPICGSRIRAHSGMKKNHWCCFSFFFFFGISTFLPYIYFSCLILCAYHISIVKFVEKWIKFVMISNLPWIAFVWLSNNITDCWEREIERARKIQALIN